MVMALGQDRLKPRKGFQVLEVNLVDLVERQPDSPFDIEVAPGENGARVEELLENRKRPAVEVRKRLLDHLLRRVRETGSQQLGIRKEARAFLVQVDHGDGLEQPDMQRIPAQRFENGSAPCRERGCQYWLTTGGADA